jgi:hypothetical protein
MTTIKAPANDGQPQPFMDHRQRQAARLHAAGRVNVGRGAVGAVLACMTAAVSDPVNQPTSDMQRRLIWQMT